MTEIIPQIVYTPEGELLIRTDLTEDLKEDSQDVHKIMLEEKHDNLTLMAEQPGVVVEKDGESVGIRIGVAERFFDAFESSSHNDLNAFLGQLNKVLPFNPRDETDRVFSVQHLFSLGAEGIVNVHFQRWMNTGLTEEAARHCAIAMTLPFGNEVDQDAQRDFNFREVKGSGAEANAYSSRIVIDKQRFGLYKTTQEADSHSETTGNVVWNSLNISTLGNCACWGAMSSDRDNVHIDGQDKKLYGLDPHNIDNAKQSLSILIGASSLAYFASKYEGREDIFADAEWGETREFTF